LQIQTQNSWRGALVRSCLGFAAFAIASTAAQAQTYYYYYPSTAASSPALPAGTATAPVYYVPSYYVPSYYVPSTDTNQVAWSGYTPVYYQGYYTTASYQAGYYVPQYYQTAYNQPTVQATYATQTTQASTPGTQYIQTSYVTQETSQPAASSAPAPTATTESVAATAVIAGDPYGFTAWLNATRAAYGLPSVGYDPNLESWAAMNNNSQASYGIGHFVMGPARRQNSAMGGFPGIESMWMASPAHAAALLDPTIRWIGIASYGAYWTFNAY
jgi:hypothetical protein